MAPDGREMWEWYHFDCPVIDAVGGRLLYRGACLMNVWPRQAKIVDHFNRGDRHLISEIRGWWVIEKDRGLLDVQLADPLSPDHVLGSRLRWNLTLECQSFSLTKWWWTQAYLFSILLALSELHILSPKGSFSSYSCTTCRVDRWWRDRKLSGALDSSSKMKGLTLAGQVLIIISQYSHVCPSKPTLLPPTLSLSLFQVIILSIQDILRYHLSDSRPQLPSRTK